MNNRNKTTTVRVTVAGLPNTGKTTIANLLRGALRQVGVSVVCADINDREGRLEREQYLEREQLLEPLQLAQRINSLREKGVIVEIVTAATNRVPVKSPNNSKEAEETSR